jgi:hypothetical protein
MTIVKLLTKALEFTTLQGNILDAERKFQPSGQFSQTLEVIYHQDRDFQAKDALSCILLLPLIYFYQSKLMQIDLIDLKKVWNTRWFSRQRS